MVGKKEPTNIQDYRRKWNFNIGVFLFTVILIYVVVTVLFYITGKHVTFYEVQEGSILKDEIYTGIAIRTEEVIPANRNGYLNFYEIEGTKVAAGDSICTVSDEKLNLENQSDTAEGQESGLSSDEQKALLSSMQSFMENYDEDAFSDVYVMKDQMETFCEDKTDQSRTQKLSNALQDEGEGSYEIYYSPRDGVLAYHIDGYEELKKEDVTESVLDKKKYTQKQVTENSEAESGKGAYKLITEEEWYVVTEISPDTAKDLLAKEKTSIQVRFLKDNMTMIAGLEIKQKDKDRYYAYLTFDNSMVRYLSERYLDIELILEDVTGLRVPKSAVIKKDCYMLPLDYIVTNGETKEKGVLVKEKNGKTRFQAADVYYQDENEKQACVSAENLPEGTVIRMQDSNNTKTLSDPVEQPGVYEAGSGYAVFTTIDIAEENEDYYITRNGISNLLSNYDRIVLDADSVEDDEILVQ